MKCLQNCFSCLPVDNISRNWRNCDQKNLIKTNYWKFGCIENSSEIGGSRIRVCQFLGLVGQTESEIGDEIHKLSPI